MKRRGPYLAVQIVATFLLVACRGDGVRVEDPRAAPRIDDPDVVALVAGQHEFTADLYRVVRSTEGNLLVSPSSIHEAFSILRMGAREESARRLDRALHLPPSGVDEGWSVLHESLRSDGQATLRVGNRLWVDQRFFTLDPGFAAKALAVHGASAVRRDLGDAEGTAREVNAWVERATDGMIPAAMTPADVTPDAGLVLANAVYFHGKWQHRFERSATQPRPFTTAAGERIEVPIMALRGEFRYREADAVRTLALPYRGGTTELVVLLPTAPDGLPRLEESLTGPALAEWITGGSVAEIDLLLPRFRFEDKHDLVPVLVSLGLDDLMDGARADLGRIGSDPRGRLFLACAKHAALVDLDEEGTKAAAATVVVGSCSAPATPTPFHCDRPFLFVIRHVPTGAVLFLGRVVSPPPGR